jgi:uncharacterized repeat protein (TIGR04138 family)
MIHHPGLAEVVRRDPRFTYEAYDFVFEALRHTQRMLGREPPEETPDETTPHHVSGRELLEGIRDLAVREFGLMARTVFRMWGITKTGDFGEIVFNLVEANLMSKTEDDCRADFHDAFDFDAVFVQAFRIELEETE